MKYWLFCLILLSASCAIKDQAEELNALKNCTYELASADSLSLANIEMSKIISSKGFNLLQSPALGMAYMRQELPLKGILNIKITNPGSQEAGINDFEYKVLIKEKELGSGKINTKTSIDPNGGTAVIPVRIDQNIYPILSDPANIDAIRAFLDTDSLKTATVTLKIKPSFMVGEKKIDYPGYISIDKPISNQKLLSSLKNLQ